MIIIKGYKFESLYEFGQAVLGEYEDHENDKDFCGVNIVAKYDVMIDILNWFAGATDFKLYDIKICPAEVDGYDEEYLLTLSYDGTLCCQEAKYDNEYIDVDDVVTFIHSGCNSKFVIKNAEYTLYEFDIDNEDEEDDLWDNNERFKGFDDEDSTPKYAVEIGYYNVGDIADTVIGLCEAARNRDFMAERRRFKDRALFWDNLFGLW